MIEEIRMIDDYSHAFHYFSKFINEKDKKSQNIFFEKFTLFCYFRFQAISGIFLPKLF